MSLSGLRGQTITLLYFYPLTYMAIAVAHGLKDANGSDVALKQGAKVEVTVEAEPEDTIVKKNTA